MSDIGPMVQRVCEEHITALGEALELESMGVLDEAIDWPDCQGPYCGCLTCVVREILYAASPWFGDLAMEVA